MNMHVILIITKLQLSYLILKVSLNIFDIVYIFKAQIK